MVWYDVADDNVEAVTAEPYEIEDCDCCVDAEVVDRLDTDRDDPVDLELRLLVLVLISDLELTDVGDDTVDFEL